MRTSMKLSTGKLSTGLLFVILTAGSAWAQIPSVVQHVQDQMNGVQQQKKAAGDAALNGNASAKAPAGKPTAATAAIAAKSAAAPAPIRAATAAAKKSSAKPAAPKPSVAAAKPAVAASAAPAKGAAPARHDPFAKGVAPKTNPKPAEPSAAATKNADTKTAN